MTKFFSLKLFREGFQKLRLAGIAITAVVTALTALEPLSKIINRPVISGTEPQINMVDASESAYPLLLILFLAPILTLNLFGFLNKRNESDFHHSIPFTRPCVYFSFLAAIVSWLLIALTAAVSLAAILWHFVPYHTFSPTLPLLIFATYFLAVLLLTAFTAVAMTVTGTLISNLLVALLLFGFLRLGGAIFIECLQVQFPLMIPALTPLAFLETEFNIPIALLLSLVTGSDAVFTHYSLWIYTAVVSVLLIAVGCILYTKRASQTAEQSASNAILQHVYRCAITLPMAFLIADYIITQRAYGTQIEGGSIVIFVVIALLLYYLYELLTTKRMKNLLKATPYLLVVAIGGLLFGGGAVLAADTAVNYTPDADELASVSIYTDLTDSEEDLSYEEIMTHSTEITDPAVLEKVAAELARMNDVITSSSVTPSDRGVDHYRYPLSYVEQWDENGVLITEQVDYIEWSIKITEKSGRVCGRTLVIPEDTYWEIVSLCSQAEDYQKALLALPTDAQIQLYYNEDCAENADELWESYRKEYLALSAEDQLACKKAVNQTLRDNSVRISGMVGTTEFTSSYPFTPEYFPKTCKLYMDTVNGIHAEKYPLACSSIKDQSSVSASFSLRHNGKGNHYYGSREGILQIIDFVDGCTPPASGGILCSLTLDAENVTDPSANIHSKWVYLLSEEDFNTVRGMIANSEMLNAGEL